MRKERRESEKGTKIENKERNEGKWVKNYKRGMGKKRLKRKWVKNDKIAFALQKRYSICLKLLKV